MRRLSLFLLTLGMAALVLAAGRAWNPPVEDWTAEPPGGWRGLDGPGFTLACPNQFVFRTERPRPGEAAMTIQPRGAFFTGLQVFVYTPAARQPSLRSFLRREVGVRSPQNARLVRLGPLQGRGESGTLATGRFWKAVALETGAGGDQSRGQRNRVSGRGRDAASLSGPVTGLVAIYEQVPGTDRAVYDRMLGSLRLRSDG